MKNALAILIFTSLFVCIDERSLAQKIVALEKSSSEIVATKRGTNLSGIDMHAVRHFVTRHPSVANVRWAPTREGYMVTFDDRRKQSMELYNRKGRWLATITYLLPGEVQSDIRKLVNEAYSCYAIFFAQEVETPKGKSCIVKIENGTDCKTLGVKDDEFVVMEQYRKAE